MFRNYASGLNANISRLVSIFDNSATLEEYDYLGLSTLVRRGHPEPDVDQTFIKQSGESNGDAGDQYIGLDRFGRIVDQRWIETTTPDDIDRFQYGYDRNSNRTYREYVLDTVFSELYAYDDLNQLIGFDRGELNGTKDAIVGTPSRSQDWDLDAMGNWDSLTNDGGTPESRTHNSQNQVTGVGSATLTFDANGNMTTDEAGRELEYDAWNRLVEVLDDQQQIIVSHAHDALGRRIAETRGSETRDLYYSASWQVLEEQVSGATEIQYVWSPVYVDAMVLRDRDTDGNGTLDERLYVAQDANWNVTALINTSGAVVERYVYDPYGAVTIYNANWSQTRSSSDYDWQYLHQGGRFSFDIGLHHFRGRDSSPTLGRWEKPDPIGFGGGDANLYRALGNNPTNLTDPNGLFFQIIEHHLFPNTVPGYRPIQWRPVFQWDTAGMRALGALKTVGGAVEMAAGAGLISAAAAGEVITLGGSTVPSGVVAAVGTGILAHGLDTTGAGLTQTVTGQPTATYTERYIGYGLQQLGMSESDATVTAGVVDTAISIVGTLGANSWRGGTSAIELGVRLPALARPGAAAAPVVAVPVPNAAARGAAGWAALGHFDRLFAQGDNGGANGGNGNAPRTRADVLREIERRSSDLDFMNEMIRRDWAVERGIEIRNRTGSVSELITELRRVNTREARLFAEELVRRINEIGRLHGEAAQCPQ